METDPTRICQILVGLPDVTVVGVDDPPDGLLVVHIESTVQQTHCPRCSTRGWVKQRTVVMLTDLPSFGRPVRLAWAKIRRICPNPACGQGSWTSTDDRIACPGSTVTHRAGRWATEQVGQHRRCPRSILLGRLEQQYGAAPGGTAARQKPGKAQEDRRMAVVAAQVALSRYGAGVDGARQFEDRQRVEFVGPGWPLS